MYKHIYNILNATKTHKCTPHPQITFSPYTIGFYSPVMSIQAYPWSFQSNYQR